MPSRESELLYTGSSYSRGKPCYHERVKDLVPPFRFRRRSGQFLHNFRHGDRDNRNRQLHRSISRQHASVRSVRSSAREQVR
jgi:hypothetical protein